MEMYYISSPLIIMYIYYEVTKPTDDPRDNLTEVVLSSDGVSTRLNWKAERDLIDKLNYFMKQIPLQERTMSPEYVWTFFGEAGGRILTLFEMGIKTGAFPKTQLKEIKNLTHKVKYSILNKVDKANRESTRLFKEEEFFYSPPSKSNVLSGEALSNKLSSLLGISPEELKNLDNSSLKKAYRLKALLYHPDRNNGDGSKMSELNELYSIYTSK